MMLLALALLVQSPADIAAQAALDAGNAYSRAAPSPAQTATDPVSVMTVCILRNARRYEVSGESPTDIAVAALNGCYDQKAALAGWIRSQGIPALGVEEFQKNMLARMQNDVVQVVVSLRSCKKTPGCVFNNQPP